MRIYTITDSRITPHADIHPHKLASGAVIPTVAVGEDGRGRKLDFIAVGGVSPLPDGSYAPLQRVSLGATQSGRPKLIAADDGDNTRAVLVLRTGTGYRGGNRHSGDHAGDDYLPLPGEILAQGTIAEGAAGRMGSGSQLIVLMPVGAIWVAHYSGRLYGAPNRHYYRLSDTGIDVLTADERAAVDVF